MSKERLHAWLKAANPGLGIDQAGELTLMYEAVHGPLPSRDDTETPPERYTLEKLGLCEGCHVSLDALNRLMKAKSVPHLRQMELIVEATTRGWLLSAAEERTLAATAQARTLAAASQQPSREDQMASILRSLDLCAANLKRHASSTVRC